MPWIDRIENTVFTIRTGDGAIFTPLWKNGETSKEFNTATFEFIDQPGALIERKKVRARKFPLVFWFQGDDNIEQTDAFDLSANDPRAWVVRHPFYGDITGQPISISRNDQLYNCTEVTVDFWETIVTQFPAATIAPADAVASRFTEFSSISPINYASKVDLKPADVNTVTNFANSITAIVNKGITATGYTAFIAAVNNLILAPVDAIASIHQVILQPAMLELSIATRIQMIGAIYQSVAQLLADAGTVNNKAFFESAAGAAIGSLSIALLHPATTDYNVRSDVTAAANNLIDMYADYLVTLDAAYVEINNTGNSFTASQESQTVLQDIVLQTLVNLDTLAFNAKQERLVMLLTDANLIVLTHKYMGLDPDDANIETFRTINNIKNASLFVVEKGTQIKYYV